MLFSKYYTFCLPETSLHDEVANDDFGLVNHNVLRCDRSVFSSYKIKIGGVVTVVNKLFACE